MSCTRDIDNIEFRVVLVDPSSRQLLVEDSTDECRLPRVSMQRKTRYARQLQIEAQRTLRATILIIEFLSICEDTSSCVVAELLTDEIPPGLRRVDQEELAPTELTNEERASLSRLFTRIGSTHLSSIGWIDQAIAWVEEAIGTPLLPKEFLDQYNGGEGYALIRFASMDGRAFWFKATGASNRHERELTRLLSTICAPHLPAIVAEKPEWNAWVTREEACSLGSIPTEPQDLIHHFGCALQTLAEIQKKSAGHEQALLQAGAFDHRASAMRAQLDPLFAYMSQAMNLASSNTYIPAERLKELHELLDRAYGRTEHLKVPSTILHGDINRGNMLVADKRCQLIDWSDGFVGCPFVTLEHALLLNRIENPALRADVNRQLRDTYCDAMSNLCSPEQIEEMLIFAPLLAVISAFYGRGDWLHNRMRDDPRRLRYARSMARHLDLAARNPLLLERMSS